MAEMTVTEQSVIDAMDTEFDGVDKFDIVQELLGLRTRLTAADKEIADKDKRIAELEGGVEAFELTVRAMGNKILAISHNEDVDVSKLVGMFIPLRYDMRKLLEAPK
jgi:hypothetical protein